MEPTARQPIVSKHVLRIRNSLGSPHILGKYDTAEQAQAAADRTEYEVISITVEDVQLHF